MEAKSLKTIISELDQYAPMIDDIQVETVAKMAFHALGITRIFCGGNHDTINWRRRLTCDWLWFRFNGQLGG